MFIDREHTIFSEDEIEAIRFYKHFVLTALSRHTPEASVIEVTFILEVRITIVSDQYRLVVVS